MKKRLFSLLLFFFHITFLSIAQLPSGFVDELVYQNGFTIPTGLAFDDNGKAYIWEKTGLVHVVHNGTRTTLIDISNEVGSWFDNGLNGFALDPNYLTNGYIYLLYVVDCHYLKNEFNIDLNTLVGKKNYEICDYNNPDGMGATIGRITRYTINNPATHNPTVNYSSRHVVLGTTLDNGIPIVTDNHGLGSLVFGTDYTLLVSNGDGANVHFNNSDSPFGVIGKTLGILKASEALNHMRVQDSNSLSGKILRIDPVTGQGIPSNPYYNPSDPNDDQSKVWAKGFRNPFRFSLKPNTGSHHAHDGDPGILYVGDVGWNTWEEFDVVPTGGLNFGWPKYEGMSYQPNFGDYTPTIFGTHTLPLISYPHNSFTNYVSQGLTASGIQDFGTTSFNYPKIFGNCSIGGVFYTGNKYPPQYTNKYWAGEYENPGWIKVFETDANDLLVSYVNYAASSSYSNPTAFAYNPVDDCIYYTRFLFNSATQLRRINYNPAGGNPPHAVLQQDKIYGNSPLTIKFFGNLSTDPENNISNYQYDFGDGSSPVFQTDTEHTFSATGSSNFEVKFKVTDTNGNADSVSREIYVNNTPPIIISSSLDTLCCSEASNYSINLDVNAVDSESVNLTYKWAVELVHNTHSHLLNEFFQKTVSLDLDHTPQDENKYNYRITLTVTDEEGLSSTQQGTIFFDKNSLPDVEKPTNITNLIYKVTGQNTGVLEWTGGTDDNGIFLYEIFKDDQKFTDKFWGENSLEIADHQNGIETIYKIVTRDSSGKASVPKFLYFSFSNPTCAPLVQCNYLDQTPLNQPTILTVNTDSSGLKVIWGGVTGSDIFGYEVLLNGNKIGETSMQNFTIPHSVLSEGTYYIQVQSVDNSNNKAASDIFDFYYDACPDVIEVTTNITNSMGEFKAKISLNAINKIDGSSSDVLYKSEQNVNLNPGFEVSNGAVFRAIINHCY